LRVLVLAALSNAAGRVALSRLHERQRCQEVAANQQEFESQAGLAALAFWVRPWPDPRRLARAWSRTCWNSAATRHWGEWPQVSADACGSRRTSSGRHVARWQVRSSVGPKSVGPGWPCGSTGFTALSSFSSAIDGYHLTRRRSRSPLISKSPPRWQPHEFV